MEGSESKKEECRGGRSLGSVEDIGVRKRKKEYEGAWKGVGVPGYRVVKVARFDNSQSGMQEGAH